MRPTENSELSTSRRDFDLYLLDQVFGGPRAMTVSRDLAPGVGSALKGADAS